MSLLRAERSARYGLRVVKAANKGRLQAVSELWQYNMQLHASLGTSVCNDCWAESQCAAMKSLMHCILVVLITVFLFKARVQRSHLGVPAGKAVEDVQALQHVEVVHGALPVQDERPARARTGWLATHHWWFRNSLPALACHTP